MNIKSKKIKKQFYINIFSVFILGIFILSPSFSFAADYYSVVNNGNWNVTATWSTICGGAGGAGIPTASDNVIICSGITVNINANGNCNNLTIQGTGILNFNKNAKTLNVGGNLTMSDNAQIIGGANSRILNVAGSMNVNSSSTVSIAGIQLNVSGTTTIDGQVTFSDDIGVKTFINPVTVNASGAWTSTAIITTTNLIFQNGITHNGTSFQAGACTFNTNNQNLAGSTAMSFANVVTVTGVTVTNNTTVSITNTAAGALAGTGNWTQGANSTLNYSGSTITVITLNATTNPNTVNYNCAGGQTVYGVNYNNLTLSNTSAKTLTTSTTSISGNLTLSGTATTTTVVGLSITGNLAIGNGTTFTAAAFDLAVTGTTTVGEGTNGTFTLSGASGARTFTGLVTVNSGATWNNSGNTAVTFRGGITNSSTFTAGSGIQTFDTNPQSLTGTFTIASVTVNGVILTNNNTLTVSTALDGIGGGLTQAASSTLYISFTGPPGITTLTATANPNTVDYNSGVAQTIKGTTYHHLIISVAGIKTLNAATTVNGNLTISAGTFADAGYIVTVKGNVTNNGTHSSTGSGKIYLNSGSALHTISGGTNTFGNVELDDAQGASWSGTGTTAVSGNLTVSSGTLTLVDFTTSFSVSGSTVISGSLFINDNTTVKTFVGSINITAGASWTSTVASTAANLIFNGAITHLGSSFQAGGATFISTNLIIGGGQPMSFANDVSISGATTVVKNQNTAGITITGVLNGTVAGSIWNNDINSILYYENATQPMATGILTATANLNTVYYSLGSAQTIKGTPYYHLIISGGAGTKTLGAATTVNGNFNLTSTTTFDPAGFDFTVSGATTIYGSFSDGTEAGITNLQNTELNVGTIHNAGATGVINILGNLNITNGNGTIGRVALTVSGTTTVGSGRTLTLNSNNGIDNIKTFSGAVTNNGTWVSTIITTAGNLIFQNGITNNGTSFTAGSATFNTNSQPLSGNTALSFANFITVTGVTVTNNATVSITNTGADALTGTGIWTQGSVGTLNYAGSTITISSLDASASGNTVDYNSNLLQTIKAPATSYYNLNISSTDIKTLSSAIDVNGNLSISGTAVFDVSTFDITLAGNWNNTSTNTDPFIEGIGTVTFDGTLAQNIFNTGNPNGTAFNNITINNTSSITQGVTIANVTSVSGILTLTQGIVNTTPSTGASTLTLNNGATTSIGVGDPNPSYINGQLINTVATSTPTTVYFPLGKVVSGVSNWRPCELMVTHSDASSVIYTGELIQSSAQALGYTLPSTVDRVSYVRYWTIDRSSVANLTNANIKLYYKTDNGNDDQVTDYPNLTIVKSTGSVSPWIDIGGTATANGTGSIGPSDAFTSFSKFTLGNKTGGGNPLPIELLYFNAECNDGKVNMNWATTSETNNDYFTVEKSKDAKYFETVTIVSGAGNSNEEIQYNAQDNEPYEGTSYYRLMQTDFDGQFTYSDVVSVNFSHQNNTSITWWQEGSILNLNIISSYEGSAVIEIYDYSGRLIQKHNFSTENRSTITTFNTDVLKKGFYILRILLGNEQKTIKVYYH